MEPAMGYYLAQNRKYILDYGHEQYNLELLVQLSKEPGL